MPASLRVGHGRREITPPVGTRLLGYAQRTQPSEGVHDPLQANAVAFSDGLGATAIVIALDLCWLDLPEVAALKEAVRTSTGVPTEQVLVNFSHTHAGPVVARFPGGAIDDVALRLAIEGSAAAAADTIADLRPATLEVGAAPVDIGTNRREWAPDRGIILGVNPEGPTLGEATVWLLRREGGADVALWSVPIHGTVMGGENLLISAEWMGDAARKVEAEHPGLRAVFLQGCCADQNPYRGERSFRQMDLLGSKAARAVDMALSSLRPVAALPLVGAAWDMALPLDEGGTAPCPIHGLRLGDAALVGLGGEAFVEYALYARARSQARSTLGLGYTDGSVGYLPTAVAYEEGGYEPTSYRYFALGKPWSPAVEGAIKGELERMLARLGVAR